MKNLAQLYWEQYIEDSQDICDGNLHLTQKEKEKIVDTIFNSDNFWDNIAKMVDDIIFDTIKKRKTTYQDVIRYMAIVYYNDMNNSVLECYCEYLDKIGVGYDYNDLTLSSVIFNKDYITYLLDMDYRNIYEDLIYGRLTELQEEMVNKAIENYMRP